RLGPKDLSYLGEAFGICEVGAPPSRDPDFARDDIAILRVLRATMDVDRRCPRGSGRSPNGQSLRVFQQMEGRACLVPLIRLQGPEIMGRDKLVPPIVCEQNGCHSDYVHLNIYLAMAFLSYGEQGENCRSPRSSG